MSLITILSYIIIYYKYERKIIYNRMIRINVFSSVHS